MASALAGILHQIQVLVSTDLLDANEHGAASWPPIQDTTHNIPQRQDVNWLSRSERSYFSTTLPKPAPKTQLFRGFPPPARGKVPNSPSMRRISCSAARRLDGLPMRRSTS